MARKLIVEIIGKSDDFERALGRSGVAAEGFGGKLASVAKVAGVATVALGGLAAVGLKKSIDAATQFQSSMELIQTQAGGSAEEVNKMSAALVGMAASVGKTPDELAKGLYHVESAGFRGAKALSILRLAAEGAAVGHSDLEQTTTALVAAQRSGISGLGNMSHAMGSLNAIVGAGNMRMEDLTGALSTGILPAAKAFGLRITDVGAALATMTSNGIPAVNAAAGLRMMFISMSAPTKQAVGLLKDIGLSSTDLADTLRSKGLFTALTELKTHMETAGMTATEQGALLAGAFGRKSSAGLLTLIGNLQDVKTAQDQVSAGASSFGENWEQTQKTSAFATERFKAGLSALEVQVGAALLPTFDRMLNWVNAHWPQISAVVTTSVNVIGRVIESVKPVFEMLIRWTTELVNYTRDHWAQISARVSSAMSTIRSIIAGVTAAARAIWSQFGSAITEIADRTFKAAISIIRNAFAIIQGVFQLVGDLIHGRWAKVWDDIKQIVSNALQAMVTIIATMVSNAYTEALAIGKALVGGIVDGLKGLASDVGGAMSSGIHSAIGGVKSVFGIHSPSTVTSQEIGVPLGQGVLDGWTTSTQSLGSLMASQLKKAIDASKAVVAAGQSAFRASFEGFQSIADQMFSGIGNAAQTAAGKVLARLTAAHDAAQLAGAVTTARSDLATAQAGTDGVVDPAAVLSARQALADALYNQKVANLSREAAQEQIDLTARNQVKQIAFDNALGKLEEHLQKTHASTKSAMEAITKLLSSYGVSFAAVGADMGRAWVDGLRDAIMEAAKGSGALNKVIQGQGLTLGGLLGGVPHAATGGYVAETGLAVIHKGENVVPAGSGGGGSYTFNFPNYMGDRAELERWVTSVVVKANRNGGLLLGDLR